ncbi:MAG: hypothetical protein KDK70_09720 [Myxococcales bacterium]|nr:hypothetical protein [Myxococcales bacterium]
MIRRTRLVFVLAVAGLLVTPACDDGAATKTETKPADGEPAEAKSADGEPAKPAEAKPSDGAMLTMGAAKLIDESKPDQVIELRPDGGIALNGSPLGVVSTDGKLVGPDGRAFVVAGADGKVVAGGKSTGIELVDGGARIDMGKKIITLTFAEDGKIVAEPKSDGEPSLRHEGCTGPVAKTCALVLLGMMLPMARETKAAAPPAGGGSPP